MDKDKNNQSYSIAEILSDRFGKYAKYIIQERALPDARDGLKPVQRRIIFAMSELNLHNTSNYKKSARVVGDVIGKYHPHGDTSVYEALVRLSQSWKSRYPLIDMHGNNGSIDGDNAAAMRYTEVRLSKISSYLLSDLEKNTVQFNPNFDDSETEPTVLTALYPNLLANGATGIAAGYATNIPPHNIGEIIQGVIHRINYPNSSLDSIMKYILGPDFPTGGIIQGIEGIKEAYETGKGRIIIRSKFTIENNKIHIFEIPYEVVKQDLVRKIDEIRMSHSSLGIKSVLDATSRNGLEIIIELDSNANADFIRKYLLKNTNLQVSYSINLVSIINHQPKQTGLLPLLDSYIEHQKNVLTNKSKYNLAKALKRLEIIEGLIKVVSVLDEVIKIIRASVNRQGAIDNLIEHFQFTPNQAEAIVQLRLYRLTSTDILSLEEEQKALQSKIESLKMILGNKKFLNKTLINQLKDVASQFADHRRSLVEPQIENILIDTKEEVAKKECVLTISKDGYLRLIEHDAYKKLHNYEFPRKPGDIINNKFITFNTNKLVAITSNGNYVVMPIHKINFSRPREVGFHLNSYAKINDNATIVSSFVVNSFDNLNQSIFTVSKLGYIKKTLISKLKVNRFSKSFQLMKLKPDDKIVSAEVITNPQDLFLVSRKGNVVRYNIDVLSETNPKTMGIQGMKLRDDEVISGFTKSKNLIFFSEDEGVKKISLNQITYQNRPAKGSPPFYRSYKNPIAIKFALPVYNNNIAMVNSANELIHLQSSTLAKTALDKGFNEFAHKDIINMSLEYEFQSALKPEAMKKASHKKTAPKKQILGKVVNLSKIDDIFIDKNPKNTNKSSSTNINEDDRKKRLFDKIEKKS